MIKESQNFVEIAIVIVAMSGVVNKSPRTQMTTVEPWEVAYFNGAALLDEIPVGNRDTHEQYALRDHSQPAQEVKVTI